MASALLVGEVHRPPDAPGPLIPVRPPTTGHSAPAAYSSQASNGTSHSAVRDPDSAIEWQLLLEQWWQSFGHLTTEQTLFRNDQFGSTHDRLRKAWLLVRLVVKKDLIFTHITYGNPRTTSPLEGLNAHIRDLLRRHRGMSEKHRRRALEWFLTLHELPLEHALDLAKPVEPVTGPAPDEEPIGPALYDTGLDAGEGLWSRAGWAGRE
ncbi:hypothetical protein [Microbacterium amylolyticum]|uniref:Transposase n=1 Tax=Microbacterium amylolyticum TaxID=936337 RepID=A0ABS4ZIE2_9MICO|nr:hypothetical protein [Microbacterium amylolyticum]MBP2436261.1 hypothetical protein [Microbacterium amylolyticum]